MRLNKFLQLLQVAYWVRPWLRQLIGVFTMSLILMPPQMAIKSAKIAWTFTVAMLLKRPLIRAAVQSSAL